MSPVSDQSSGSHELTAALRGIAEEDRRAGASDLVAAKLRAEFRAVSAVQRAARARRFAAKFAAVAALVTAIAVPAWRLSRRSAEAPHVAGAQTGAKADEIVTDFMPLTYSGVPISGGQVVRLEVPRTALAAFGLTPDAQTAPSTDTVLADVVVGDDG